MKTQINNFRRMYAAYQNYHFPEQRAVVVDMEYYGDLTAIKCQLSEHTLELLVNSKGNDLETIIKLKAKPEQGLDGLKNLENNYHHRRVDDHLYLGMKDTDITEFMIDYELEGIIRDFITLVKYFDFGIVTQPLFVDYQLFSEEYYSSTSQKIKKISKDNLELIREGANPIIEDSGVWKRTISIDKEDKIDIINYVESYLRYAYEKDEIVNISLNYYYLYNIEDEFKYRGVDVADCELRHEPLGRKRKVKVGVKYDWINSILYCWTQSLSTYGIDQLSLPIDTDFAEALEYLSRYGNN